ncbi:MAG: hypothetical protein ACUZ8I_14975 [Candidatus Scalindua sp.]
MNIKSSNIFECNTPLAELDLLNYQLSEERSVLVEKKKKLDIRRTELNKELFVTSKTNLKKWKKKISQYKGDRKKLKEWFDVGDDIQNINVRITEINDKITEKVPMTYPEMFIHIAAQLLLKKEFERVKKYSRHRWDQLAKGIRDK